MSNEKGSRPEIIDTEFRCLRCLMPLYVTAEQADALLNSLNRIGAFILVCTCGQAQIVRRKLPHRYARRND